MCAATDKIVVDLIISLECYQTTINRYSDLSILRIQLLSNGKPNFFLELTAQVTTAIQSVYFLNASTTYSENEDNKMIVNEIWDW